MKKTALTIDDATIGYRQGKKVVSVAEGINVSLHCGELVALIGRNGAGKSTLLRTLSAFQKPLLGVVCLSGKNVSDLSTRDVSKEVAVVLTATEAAPLTVRELVSLGRTPYTDFIGRMTAKDVSAVDKAINAMGIEHLADRKLATLSDGERQKCMIAKALAQETPIILLDEPTAFLDFASKVNLLRLLKQLAQEEQKAILVSTHDIELALRLADGIWLLKDGKLNAGSIDELANSGALQNFICDAGIRYDKTERRIEII